MSRRPPIRVVIDRIVLPADGSVSEASLRRQLASGMARALAERGASLRGEHPVVRIESAPSAAAAYAAGVALGGVLAGKPGTPGQGGGKR